MRFIVTNELQKSIAIRWMIGGVMVLILLFLAGHLLLEAIQLGWRPNDVLQTVAGNEDEFIDPLPFDEILLRAHINLFFAMIVLAIGASAYVRIVPNSKQKILPITVIFSTALFAQISLILIRSFGLPAVWIWIVTSMLWHTVAGLMVIRTLWYLGHHS